MNGTKKGNRHANVLSTVSHIPIERYFSLTIGAIPCVIYAKRHVFHSRISVANSTSMHRSIYPVTYIDIRIRMTKTMKMYTCPGYNRLLWGKSWKKLLQGCGTCFGLSLQISYSAWLTACYQRLHHRTKHYSFMLIRILIQ